MKGHSFFLQATGAEHARERDPEPPSSDGCSSFIPPSSLPGRDAGLHSTNWIADSAGSYEMNMLSDKRSSDVRMRKRVAQDTLNGLQALWSRLRKGEA